MLRTQEPHDWSDEKDAQLIEYYQSPTIKVQEIADMMECSQATISRRAKKLGLSKTRFKRPKQVSDDYIPWNERLPDNPTPDDIHQLMYEWTRDPLVVPSGREYMTVRSM